MSKLVSWMVGTALVVTASQAAAQPISILPSSLVRVRADNHFGVTKDVIVNPPVFDPLPFSSTITDTEVGTGASATNSATYEVSLTGTTAVFDIQTTQSHSAGATGNLTEGFIQFTLTEAFAYELSGNYGGTSADAGDAYQQRTFLRQFQSPFTTVYLEDETRIATVAALYVNQGNDTGGTAGSTFNQSGPMLGVLLPGTYEFAYELESSDRDGDQAVGASATGHVRLVLRKPLPPTNVQAVTTGQSVALSWTASPDADSYILQAGSAPGASNFFSGPIGPLTALQAPARTGRSTCGCSARAAGCSARRPRNHIQCRHAGVHRAASGAGGARRGGGRLDRGVTVGQFARRHVVHARGRHGDRRGQPGQLQRRRPHDVHRRRSRRHLFHAGAGGERLRGQRPVERGVVHDLCRASCADGELYAPRRLGPAGVDHVARHHVLLPPGGHHGRSEQHLRRWLRHEHEPDVPEHDSARRHLLHADRRRGAVRVERAVGRRRGHVAVT